MCNTWNNTCKGTRKSFTWIGIAVTWKIRSYLDRLYILLGQCRSAISSLTFLSILNHPHNLQSMVSKLPFPLQDRWRREANKRRLASGTIPTFDDFVNFVNTEDGLPQIQSFREKPSVAWMAHPIDPIPASKAEVPGRLKLTRAVLAPRITSPFTQLS